MGDRRAVVIGLDGVSLADIELAVNRGLMPTTSGLLRRSAVSSPRVLVPYTAPSWTSIATGVNPGKHNVYDFVVPEPGKGLRLVDAGDVMFPRMNEVLAMNRVPSITVGLPFSYPPTPRWDGCAVIAGWTSPRPRVWPPGLKSLLQGFEYVEPRGLSVSSYGDALARGLEARLGVEEELLGREDWRLYFTILPQFDQLFHKAYGEWREGRLPAGDRLFRLADRLVSTVLREVGGEVLLIMVSDHGFSTALRAINVNVLLRKMGLLRVRGGGSVGARVLRAGVRVLSRFPRLLHALKYRGQVVAKALGVDVALGQDAVTAPVDYAASAAFLTASYNLYTNPLLSEGERASIVEKVASELRRLGEYEVLARGSEYYQGPFRGRAPDLIAIPAEGLNLSARLVSTRVVEEGRWYVHGLRGLLLVHGEGIEPGERSMSELQVAPTVYAHLGVALPRGLDARPLQGSVGPVRDYARLYRGLKRARRGL